MKRLLLLIVCAACYIGANGQTALSWSDDHIKGKALYLNIEQNKLKYFAKDPDQGEELQSKHQLSLKHTYANVYIKWYNPLKYRIVWKDSVYADDRDVAVNNFVGLIVTQFGPALGTAGGMAKSVPAASKIGVTALASPVQGTLNSLDLLHLYIYIKDDIDNAGRIQQQELVKINTVLKELFILDDIANISIPDTVKKSLLNLMAITTYTDVARVCKEERARKASVDVIADIKKHQELLSQQVKEIAVDNDPLIGAYIAKSAMAIADQLAKNNEVNKVLLTDIDSIINVVDASVKSTKSEKQDGYFFARTISFEPGKVMETGVTLSEYTYNQDKAEFVKKGDLFQSTVKFRKSDFVIVNVSAGIFFAQTSLKGFGVATEGGQLKVTEDIIDKNTAVAATFLNLFFNLGSRYFSPLVQLGVDPTKKHPFLLAGIGFAIPAAHFSISGGPLWTWDASLDKLSVGGTVNATTDLEKDIKYKFDGKPKGWYLGVQYNF